MIKGESSNISIDQIRNLYHSIEKRLKDETERKNSESHYYWFNYSLYCKAVLIFCNKI